MFAAAGIIPRYLSLSLIDFHSTIRTAPEHFANRGRASTAMFIWAWPQQSHTVPLYSSRRTARDRGLVTATIYQYATPTSNKQRNLAPTPSSEPRLRENGKKCGLFTRTHAWPRTGPLKRGCT
jgi:hypothetical protein